MPIYGHFVTEPRQLGPALGRQGTTYRPVRALLFCTICHRIDLFR
jgi:hypothetical protein